MLQAQGLLKCPAVRTLVHRQAFACSIKTGLYAVTPCVGLKAFYCGLLPAACTCKTPTFPFVAHPTQ